MEFEYAGYNFKLGDDKGYNSEQKEVCVKATNYADAKKLAEQLIKGSKLKLGELRRVIDCRVNIQQSDVTERRLIVEEHQIGVVHSGEITEVRVDGGKR